MQILQNQTYDKHLNDPSLPKIGTGIFAIADVSSIDPNAVKVYYVENMPYEECVARGALAVAFKWLPMRWGDITKLPCEGMPCVQTCPPLSGCICINSVCQKPQSSLP